MTEAENSTMIAIEVAYALPNKQQIIALEVAEGTSVKDAVLQSGIEKQFEGLDVSTAKLGIWGKAVTKPEQVLIKAGERIEIYRPLVADPKEVRKQRAAKVKAEKAKG